MGSYWILHRVKKKWRRRATFGTNQKTQHGAKIMTQKTESYLLENLAQNPFVLAPMAGITDYAFRSLMKRMGAGVVVTELVSSAGIEFRSERTLKLMSFSPEQHPVGIQLFGEDPEILARAAQVAEDMGCDFVDLNFGCPVPKVVKKGAGSAMLKDLETMQKVLNSVKKAIRIPLTIKIRTGWDASSRRADEVCHLAWNEGVTWVAIHGRTRAQGYSGLSDWDYIAKVKSTSKVPVLGNGDIHSAKQAVTRLKSSQCDGVLIGRGCLKNPYIFSEALELWKSGPALEPPRRDFKQVFLTLQSLLEEREDERIINIQLKKFASWFATGYPGAAHFRKTIFAQKSNQDVVCSVLDFFESIQSSSQLDTSHEDFLMGGHG